MLSTPCSLLSTPWRALAHTSGDTHPIIPALHAFALAHSAGLTLRSTPPRVPTLRRTRDTEAAVFYFTRALRKLRLAGLADKDAHTLELKDLMEDADAQMDALRRPRPSLEGMPPAAAAGASARYAGAPSPTAAGDDYYSDYCVVS